jgi:hypothetical protein
MFVVIKSQTNMEGYITITKKGRKQRVSEEAFKNWGKDKNGWEIVHSETTVDNTLSALPTGEAAKAPVQPAEQKVDNTAPKTDGAQKVENTATDNQPKENKTTLPSANKLEFEKAATGLSRAALKELLEKPTINVPYNKKAKSEELIAILGEALGYDAVRLQKELE